MTPEERLAAYRVCQERGHQAASADPESEPCLWSWQTCRFCGTEYRTESEVLEILYSERSARSSAATRCSERGHAPSGEIKTSNPPWYVCKFCRAAYRTEPKLVERNAPEEPQP